jgi:uncharacterized protein YjdB
MRSKSMTEHTSDSGSRPVATARKLIACGAIALALAAALAGCGNKLLGEVRDQQTSAVSPSIVVSKAGGGSIAAGGTYDFGTEALGGTLSATLTIGNSGKSDLVVASSGITIASDSGTPDGTFSVSATALDIKPGASASLALAFKPAAAQSYGATLKIASNDVSTPSFTVKLSGSGSATSKAMTVFGFTSLGVSGAINESSKTIAVSLPTGTSVTNLVATFTYTGVKVMIGSVEQTSNSTANNFTNPVTYRVYAQDGSYSDYVVTVSLASSTASLASQSAAIYAGTGGTADYTLTTTAIADGTAVTLDYYTTAAGTIKSSATPTGITYGISTLSGNSATIEFTITSAASAGSYYFKVTVGSSLTTSLATLTITNVAVTGVSLSATSVSVAKGGTTTLTATISPTNATNKGVTWTSSDTSIATVSSTGVVTGVAWGSATITATTSDGSYTATEVVKVGIVSTFSTGYSYISCIAFSSYSGNYFYITDPSNYTVKSIAASAGGTPSIYAGISGTQATAYGSYGTASFYIPTCLCTYGEYIYVCDRQSGTTGTIISKIDMATRAVSQFAAINSAIYLPAGMVTNGTYLYIANEGKKKITRIKISDGTSTDLSVGDYTRGIALDSSGTYLYASVGNKIVRIQVNDFATMTTFAGSDSYSGNVDGASAVARFYYPADLVCDSAGTYFYVADRGNGQIRQVSQSTGYVTTIATGLSYSSEAAYGSGLILYNGALFTGSYSSAAIMKFE